MCKQGLTNWNFILDLTHFVFLFILLLCSNFVSVNDDLFVWLTGCEVLSNCHKQKFFLKSGYIVVWYFKTI